MVKKALFTVFAAALVVGMMACGGGEKTPPAAQTEAPQEEMMTDSAKAVFVAANCVCAKCPSYTKECADKKLAGFCLSGNTEYIKEEKGCICAECPVTAKIGLKWGYYCTKGSAKEFMEKEAMDKPAEGKSGS
ncbi:MAG: DUF2769 domain-containing protein [bacterium]